MKQSSGEAGLSFEQEEPLDVAGDGVEPTQVLELEPQRIQDQGNVEEESIQAASGVSLQSTQALESPSFQDVKSATIPTNREIGVQPTQADLELESDNFQEQPNVEEVAIQANSGVAVHLMQAGPNFQEQPKVEEGAIQLNIQEGAIEPFRGNVAQPAQAGLGLESHNFLEQPNDEEREGAVVQPIQVALLNLSNFEGMTNEDLNDILQTFANEGEHDIIEEILQIVTGQVEASHQEELGGNDRSVPQDPPSDTSNLRNDQAEVLHQEETGINIGVVPQTPPSDMNNMRNCQFETPHQEEEEARIDEGIIPQYHPSDMDNLRNDGWIELADLDKPLDGEEDIHIQAQASQQQMQMRPTQQGSAGHTEAPGGDMDNVRNDGWVELADMDEPVDGEEDTGIQARAGQQQIQSTSPQQGTAGHRMRLQVPLFGARGPSEPSEPKRIWIASRERTCMCGEMALEKEAEFFPTEPADLLWEDATCSSARITLHEGGDAIGPLRAEGLIACVSKPEDPDVVQLISQDVSGFSLPALVHLFLGCLGDACILPAFAVELSNEMNGSAHGISNSAGCLETELEGRQSMVCYLNNTRSFLRQTITPGSSTEEVKITKMQHELGDCRKPCMGCGSGPTVCRFWIAMLTLIFLCLFHSFYRLTRMTVTSL